MEPEARYTLIGAIVLALTAAAAAALLWLSGAGAVSDYHYYTIYFERQSLEGLQVGGDVNMRGVKVGRVEDFQISRENTQRVSVLVRVEKKTPVSNNSQAVISRNLVTGIAKIDLETVGEPGPPLVETPKGERYPVIAEGYGGLDEITETASGLVGDADEALKNLNKLLSADNRAAIGSILGSVQAVALKLDARLDTMQDSAASLEKTAVAFEKVATDISRTMNHVGRHVEPVTKEAGKALRDMRLALREIARTAHTVERSTTTLTMQASNAAETGVTELRATARDLRHGVDLLSRTLDRLQDPRAALLGPGENQLGPGENR